MKNTRNRVVLTESQLNSVIAESVRQVLSEIDWKTYANAAKKAWKYKDMDRFRKFSQAAEDRFGEDYGYEDETGKIRLTSGRWDDGNVSFSAYPYDHQGNQHGIPSYGITNRDFYGQNGRHKPGKWCVSTVGWAGAVAASPDFDTREEAQQYADEHGMPTKRTILSPELKNALSRAWEEEEKYDPYTGASSTRDKPRYQYMKGKGWIYPSDEQ